MSNVTIPGLPLATSLASGDLFEACVSPGTTPLSKRVTVDTVAGYIIPQISGYNLATNLFPTINVGTFVLDPAFNAKMRIGIGNGEAGFQIQQNDVDSFSFFEFFDPDGVSVAALDQGYNFRTNGTVSGAQLSAGNGYTGTFQVLTALPSTFKTVTVTNGIITGVA